MLPQIIIMKDILMQKILKLAFVCFLGACSSGNTGDYSAGDSYDFYVGTYTGGDSRGIYKFSLGADGIIIKHGLSALTENPSFLAWDAAGKYLLAVNETGPEGSVEAYRPEGDSLVLTGHAPSGGAHPCYVSLNKQGYVLAANYSSGTVGLLRLGPQGELSGLLDISSHSGSGTTERQQSPHAHFASFDPDGSGVISVDLGTNELWFSTLDTTADKLITSEQEKLAMKKGAGPRHLAVHPGGEWLYVINELNSTVTLVKKQDGGLYSRGPSYSTLPEGFDDDNYCADIHLSADGSFVYASNRGHNSIAIFKVDAKTGFLSLAGHSPSGGSWPRNFSLSPDGKYLLVANQHTNNIVSFLRDTENGLLEAVDTASVADPVCVRF